MTALRHDPLTLEQRKNVETTLLRTLRARYPGRAVSIDWDDPDTLADGQAAPRDDDDRVEHVA